MSTSENKPKGVAFLTTKLGDEPVFTPDQLNADQLAFATTAEQFMAKEIHPIAEELETQARDNQLMVEKLRKAGELGLLMLEIPEQYGGLDVDTRTSMAVAEKMATYMSFSVSMGAHTGIGSLPIVYFGNEEQRARYLPKLATGELLAAYALTEPSSGSDALGAKTTAVLEDGSDGKKYWRLNGSKMWITNSGFADVFCVFAKVDGEKFSAFIVPGDSDGLSTGAEEKKMGIKGSSTRMLVLEDVRIPEENLLGQIGKGHKIAFNILNIGRFKLGVAMGGLGKHALGLATKYAQERVAFGQSISEFGAIREKLANMAAELYALESMYYRVAGYLDETIEPLDSAAADYPEQLMRAIEEFAVECSILKVYGSEVASRVIDEGVSIHGGYGFSSEYEIERLYRDARINRIYEGTNEINRMLIPGMVVKRAMSGKLDLMSLVAKVQEAAAGDKPPAPAYADDALDFEIHATEQMRNLTLYVANLLIQKHMANLQKEQELMCRLADMLTATLVADSTVARTLQQERNGKSDAAKVAATKLIVADAAAQVESIGASLLPGLVGTDALSEHDAAIARFQVRSPADRIALRRTVADAVVAAGGWCLS